MVEVEVDVGVEVEAVVAVAPSLQLQKPADVSRYPCRSGRVPAGSCSSARSQQALHWLQPCQQSLQAPCRDSWVVV